MMERCDGPTGAGTVMKNAASFVTCNACAMYGCTHVSQPAEEPGHDVYAALRCLLLSPGADYPREAGKFDPTTTYGGDFKVQYGTVASQPLPLGDS